MIAPEDLAAHFGRPATGPLAGVVVADLSRVLAGPYATMLLADMGALVIKIESPGGDDTRGWVPPARDGEGTYFLSVNRGKFSIALDFADPDQLAVVHDIIARADVLVENFKPGGLARYGLDHVSVNARHPSLVYGSITGFGPAGGADLPGYDLLAQAVSGLMSVTGAPDGEPTKVGAALVDVITGLHASAGILAALNARHATGRGDHVEVNLLSSILSGLVNQTSAFVAGGVVPERMGNAHPSLSPYEPFPTADHDLVLAVGNDGQFARLCEVVGAPEWALDERFATMGARNAHREALRELLSARLRTRGSDEWFALLRTAGVPSGPITGVDGGVRLADSLGLEPVALTGRGERMIPTVRHPISYASADVDYSQAPPLLDADRERVLAWLGSTR
ncbi:CaiB/BaiF CoA transferase family protein [Microbacterium fluvii]|uniref:CaiB/BaiF CoA transferase family protein n=1 Tax=Microbacterium fluvii TaxID=415215 RepID=A0ABW2HE78_9MICO|nr:CoA transferase [Microbacterium fluvii]MCU4673270.1 CoA transferase [Microbacterium fluvii]